MAVVKRLQIKSEALVAMLLLSLLAGNVESLKARSLERSDECNTPQKCTASQVSLAGVLQNCRSAAEGKSYPVRGDACCNGVTSLNPSCLCKALELALDSPFLNLNTPDTLSIPKNCGYKVPRTCKCGKYQIPSALGV